MTEVGEDAMHALKNALVEGKNAWWCAAKERLGPLIFSALLWVPGIEAEGEKELRQAAEDALDCLHERLLSQGKGR